MVKIGVFIEAIQLAVAQGAIKADVAAEAIKLYTEVGEFFLRRNLFDQAAATDQEILAFEKRVQEALFTIDRVALGLSRAVGPELLSAADVATKGAGKSRSSTATTADTDVITFGKAITELLSLQDVARRVVGKVRTSAATTADAIGKGVARSRASSATSTDAAVKGPNKARSSAAAASDTQSKVIGRAVQDAVNVTDDINGSAVADDDQVIQFVKSLTDPVGASDVLARIAAYGRAFTESLSAADVVSRQTSKGLADNVGFSEQGLIFWQSYVDPTYLAEDYVGNSKTF